MILDTVYTLLETLLIEELKVNFTPPANMFKLGHVDLYNDQFSNEEIEKAFKYPAVLIQFSDIIWSTQSQGIQTGEALIRFHVGQKIIADTKAGAKFQAKGLTRLRYLEEVHKVLQNFTGECFSKLDRVSSIPDTAHTNKIVDIMEYSTIITDASADTKRNLVEVNAALDVQKGNPPAIVKPQSPFIVDC